MTAHDELRARVVELLELEGCEPSDLTNDDAHRLGELHTHVFTGSRILALLDEIAALRAERAWQPIETAPVGVWVLARYTDPTRPPVIVHRAHAIVSDALGGEFYAADGTLRYPLTHWMPLPEAP